MSTAERRVLSPEPADALHSELSELFAAVIPARVRAHVDERVARATRAWPATRRRPRIARPGRRAGVVGLLAATLVISGATGRLQALYFLATGPFGVPWERGEALNLTQTVDGYAVTLDSAYADATRLALAISVVDTDRRPGTTQLEAFSAVVTDASGVYGGVGATSQPDGPYAAVNIAWKTPAVLPLPDGPRHFHVELPFIQVRDDSTPPANADAVGWNPWHRTPGPWIFDFVLDVEGGATIEPDASAEVDGVEVRVVRLIAASAMVRVEIRAEGNALPNGWMPVGEVQHRGRVYRIVAASIEADGTVALMTDGGDTDASGEWVVTLRGTDEPGIPDGPWVVRFDGP